VNHNPYCKALEELRNRDSHRLKEAGDQWCTPEAIWWEINARFNPFTLDLFTEDHNSKCEHYYTAEDNALTENWRARLSTIGGAAYANPPYSRAQQFEGEYISGTAPIMQHAARRVLSCSSSITWRSVVLRRKTHTGKNRFIDALCDFKNEHNCHVILVTHIRKKDEFVPTGKMDIKGPGAQIDMSDNMVFIWRNIPRKLDKQGPQGLDENEKRALDIPLSIFRLLKQ